MSETSKRPVYISQISLSSRGAWFIFISYRPSEITRKITVCLKEDLERKTIEVTTG
jgi:hypothetical protein